MTSFSRKYLFAISCIAFFINSAVSSDYVPVYLWQTNKATNNVPALPHVSSETFTELLRERLGKDTIVVSFVEPNLSPEDFSAVTASGEQVFSQLSQLRSGASTAYLPLVQEPVSALQKLFADDIATVQAQDFEVNSVKTAAIIVDLNDIGDDEDRATMLARHDKTIADIYIQLSKKYTNVVALFTAFEASWVTPEDVLNRKVRDTQQGVNPKADEDGVSWVVKDDRLLMYTSEASKLTLDGTDFIIDEQYSVTSQDPQDGTFTVRIKKAAGDPETELTFNIGRGYWALTNITVEQGGKNITLRTKKINPPASFSYQCTSQVFADSTGKNKWTLKNWQVQPFVNEQNHTAFGDPYFCVGFTSVPIWSGLFVTFILATIMAVGLMMMLDMKTMDRFDDPKGKTIIVNTSE